MDTLKRPVWHISITEKLEATAICQEGARAMIMSTELLKKAIVTDRPVL
jgi:hypothetical protein